MCGHSVSDGQEEKRHEADYEALPVWQKANELASQVYMATRSFPSGESEEITVQLRRAALQVPVDIAESYRPRSVVPPRLGFEGTGRLLMRLQYLLDFASRLDYLKAPTDQMLRELVEEVATALKTSQVPSRPCESESERQLKTLGKMLVLYLNDHGGRYPDDLMQFEKEYGQRNQGLDFEWVHQHVTFLGDGRACKSMPPDTLIAYDKTMLAESQETYVLFNAAYVRGVSKDWCSVLGLTDSTKEDG